MNNKEIGNQLRIARLLLGWTIHKAALNTHGEFTPSAITSYESGSRNISAERLFKLAQIYNLTITIEPSKPTVRISNDPL